MNMKLGLGRRELKMKRIGYLFLMGIIIAFIAAGCSSNQANTQFDKKNAPLPDYVLNSSAKIKETYVMASNYPKVLAQVPCFCGCGTDGHDSNLSCYIDKFDSNMKVEQWDSMSIS
ncbi:hypothetical protein E2K98_15505 [Bacillus salipaludis]|nr:hypothetical protein E2K98_15505 [Bacillus salipaludis]